MFSGVGSNFLVENGTDKRVTKTKMVFASSGAMRAGVAATVIAALASPSAVKAFGISPGAVTTGHVNILGTASSTSSSLKAGYASSCAAGEGSSTSLWSAYAVKPEMARSRGSEWRKLRTRGPGFGEKVGHGAFRYTCAWFVRGARGVVLFLVRVNLFFIPL